MFSLVKVTVIGTLADEPVIRVVEGKRKIVGLNVYTERRWCDDQAGREQQRKEWHRVVITNQHLATYAEDHLTKGDEIHLEGGLRTDFWLDPTYELQSITYITLCQEGDKLRRIADEPDCQDPEVAIGMLAMARNALPSSDVR